MTPITDLNQLNQIQRAKQILSIFGYTNALLSANIAWNECYPFRKQYWEDVILLIEKLK